MLTGVGDDLWNGRSSAFARYRNRALLGFQRQHHHYRRQQAGGRPQHPIRRLADHGTSDRDRRSASSARRSYRPAAGTARAGMSGAEGDACQAGMEEVCLDHKGMRAMFTMMNTERLAVGIQGLGLAEASYQGAVAHARDRLQGRALSGAKYADKAADPIIVHPDVRRMLLTQRAYIEGCRALAGWVAHALDEQHCKPDPARRAAAEDFVALLTPTVKALFSDLGFEATNLGLQVLGGQGHIREQGMEQYVRDCRITQIYEGTNSVQALDLVGRKLPADGGRLLRQFFHPIAGFIEERAGDPELAPFAERVAKAFDDLQRATAKIARDAKIDPDEAGATASDYLRLFGLIALAYMWARAAEVALPQVKIGADRDGFYRAKLGTARFFMERLLPQTSGLFAAIMAGGCSMMEFEDAAL
jgi:butyryl-CoA dehydrogenase